MPTSLLPSASVMFRIGILRSQITGAKFFYCFVITNLITVLVKLGILHERRYKLITGEDEEKRPKIVRQQRVSSHR